MATVFTLPFTPALGVNGTVQSGALLYFYDAGTTTPKAIYSDAALSVPHANPVVADASGRFEDIYLTPAASYRVILKTAAGVTLGDVDNLTATDSGLRADLAETTGAELIGTDDGQTLAERLEEIDDTFGTRPFHHAKSRKDYARNWDEAIDMADDLSEMVGPASESLTTGGQGKTIYKVWNQADDESREGCLRWAVTQANAAGGGRIIFNPRGSFTITLNSILIISGGNVTIDAPGRNVRIGTPANGLGLQVRSANVIIRRLQFFQHPGLYYTDDATYERDLLFVQPSTADQVWIDRCTFTEPSDGALDAFASNYLDTDPELNMTISRCRFRNVDKCMSFGSGMLAIEPEPAWATDPVSQAHKIAIMLYRNHFEGVAQRAPRVATLAFVHSVNNVHDMSPYHRDNGTNVLSYAGWALVGGKIRTECDYLRLASPYTVATSTSGALDDGAAAIGFYAYQGAFDDTTHYGPGAVKSVGTVAENSLIVEEFDASRVPVPAYSYTAEAIPAAGTLRDAWADTIRNEAGAEIGSNQVFYQFVDQATAEAAGIWADGYHVRRVDDGYMVRAEPDPVPALSYVGQSPIAQTSRGTNRMIGKAEGRETNADIAADTLDITNLGNSYIGLIGYNNLADDLVNIVSDNDIPDGLHLYLMGSTATVITVKTTGNIGVSSDTLLDTQNKVLHLIYRALSDAWSVVI